MDEQNLTTIMNLIVHSGNAKSDAMEAIQAAKSADFDQAYEKIDSAQKSLVEAHHSQTNLLTEESRGNHMEVTLLAVHSQDHLMTSIAFTDLAKEIIDLYQLNKENSDQKITTT